MSPAARNPAAILAVALCAALLAAPAGAATVRNYDLGEAAIPDPGPKGPIPVRLWGAIGVPEGPGPHPLVVVVHGRHGDNCPRAGADTFRWPCFAREQRNDLGLRHVVAALASRGLAAIAPDVNGAYTAGWGEPTDEQRWPRIVNRTLFEVAADAGSGGGRFGVSLAGRIDFRRIGLLGHSRSGHNGVRLSRSRAGHTAPAEIASGQGPVSALFLLAPVYERVGLPDTETTIVNSRCDGDVPGQGHRYLQRAARDPDRTEPIFFIRLEGANHNFYNRTLAGLGRDDGKFAAATGCTSRERLRPGRQQRWLDAIAPAFFAAALRDAREPRWMGPLARPPARLYGLAVGFENLLP